MYFVEIELSALQSLSRLQEKIKIFTANKIQPIEVINSMSDHDMAAKKIQLENAAATIKESRECNLLMKEFSIAESL